MLLNNLGSDVNDFTVLVPSCCICAEVEHTLCYNHYTHAPTWAHLYTCVKVNHFSMLIRNSFVILATFVGFFEPIVNLLFRETTLLC